VIERESSRIVEGDVPSEYRERQLEDAIRFNSHQRRRFEKRARSWVERRWCRNLKRKFRGTLGSRLAYSSHLLFNIDTSRDLNTMEFKWIESSRIDSTEVFEFQIEQAIVQVMLFFFET
jgi:hypothetical protein